MLSWFQKKKNEPWRTILLADSLGVKGEKWGCQYLERKGYTILETNFQNPEGRRLGEIDIIARFGKKIVFVEVKTRHVSGLAFGLPEENIDRRKLHKLEKIAAYYLRKNRLEEQEYGFDALSVVYVEETRSAQIRHLPDIFF